MPASPHLHDALLHAFLNSPASLFELAQAHDLALADLVAWYDHPDTQHRLAELTRVAEGRAIAIARLHHARAIERLADLLRIDAPYTEIRRTASALLRAAARTLTPPARRANPAAPNPTPETPAQPTASEPAAPAPTPEPPAPTEPAPATTLNPDPTPAPEPRANLSSRALRRRARLAALAAVAGLAAPALAQLRIATWNVSNYTSGRAADFQTAIYAQHQGRAMAPDVIVGQEFAGPLGAANFLTILNTAPASPGDWAVAPYVNGNGTDTAFFYRTSRVHFLAHTVVSQGGGAHPRDVVRYDIRPYGYTGPAATLACYAAHFKAGAAAADRQARLAEATAIRTNAASLPTSWNYLLAADLNIQTSAEQAWQHLTSASPPTGRFIDPISAPGDWNNNFAFRFIHTQAPGGTDPNQTGGMDDRFDVILLSPTLTDRYGFDYAGNPTIPYSTTTWNDPNHSYRVWGNDGSSFNQTLNVASNQMVGPIIAQALRNAPGPDPAGGHLPVFLDLRVPPELSAPAELDFGSVPQHTTAEQTITIANAGDVARWTTAGIATLYYTLSASPGFAAPPDTFAAPAGAPGNTHTITMSTATPGPITGTLTITANAPNDPTRTIPLRGVVIPACYPNCDGSTSPPILNINDFICFQSRFVAGDAYANCDLSTAPPLLNVNDFLCFTTAFAAGCP